MTSSEHFDCPEKGNSKFTYLKLKPIPRIIRRIWFTKKGSLNYFIIKKHTNGSFKVFLWIWWWKFNAHDFLFKRRGPWTLIFILRGLLNRYEFQTFSKLFIYISSIGKNFFCKKNVWEKAIYKNSKTIYQKSPLPPLSKASIHAWRTADGANF